MSALARGGLPGYLACLNNRIGLITFDNGEYHYRTRCIPAPSNCGQQRPMKIPKNQTYTLKQTPSGSFDTPQYS
jgi:hypothetical protein